MLVRPGTALAQGASTLQRKELLATRDELGRPPQDSGWSGFIRTGMSRNQDEFSDAFSATSLSISRPLEKNRTFSFSTSYNQPVTTDQDVVRRYGFGDVDLGIGYENLYSFSDVGQLAGNLSFTLPTSRASRYASMRGAVTGGLSTSWKLPSNFSLSSNHSLTAYSYKYDTADADGNTYNSPFGLTNTVGAGWGYKQLRLNAGAGLYYTQNFAGTDITVQSFTSSVAYTFAANITTALGFSWRDRILTNNSLFDDDTTVTSFSVSYIF